MTLLADLHVGMRVEALTLLNTWMPAMITEIMRTERNSEGPMVRVRWDDSMPSFVVTRGLSELRRLGSRSG